MVVVNIIMAGENTLNTINIIIVVAGILVEGITVEGITLIAVSIGVTVDLASDLVLAGIFHGITLTRRLL